MNAISIAYREGRLAWVNGHTSHVNPYKGNPNTAICSLAWLEGFNTARTDESRQMAQTIAHDIMQTEGS